MLKFSLLNEPQSLMKNSSKITKLLSFNLIDQSYNVFEFLPKDFTITTNNGSYKFNTQMIKDTSPEITEFLQKTPEKREYHLNLDDPKNTMSMIEQLYEGKEISLSYNHLLVVKKFSEDLKISCFPSFTKLSNFQNFLNLSQVTYNFKLDQTTLINFLQSIDTFFTISIAGKQYQCNIYGVRSSKKINELIEKGNQTFEYDVEDEFDNFQLICDLFNFKNIEITSSNMDSLRRFSEDLQIEFLIEKVDKFINSYENFNQVINDKQNIVDSVENLFELLYNQNKQTVDFVKDSIIKSEWIKTEEDIQELAAILGQVICYNFRQHQFLYDLIISLDQESKNYTNLKLLFPTIVMSLMNSFSFNKYNCAFIYKLYKNGFISKEEIIEKFDQFDRTNTMTSGKFNTCLLCFLPEIIESKTFSESYLFKQNRNSHYNEFFKFYYPHKLDEYKKMRDFGKPESQIAQALINDDIDSLQKAISQINDFTTMKIPFNIFDDYINNGETSLINYAANYGSVSCFKYLLLNHAEIDKYSFQYAVRGGNIEIVHIVDQYYNEKNVDIDLNISNNSIFKLNENLALDPILPTIYQHQYDLFDWILQEKYINKGQTGNKLEAILIDSSKSGNIHSLIECINNGIDFNSLSSITICQMIGEASFGGFYKYVQIAFSFIQKKIELAKKNIENSILLGNLSIFKFIIQIDPRFCNNFNDSLLIAIKMNYFHIVKYIVENYFQDDIKLSKTGLIKCLHAAIKLKSDVFEYLINKFDFNRITTKYGLLGNDYIQFSYDACLVGNLKNIEILTNLIMSKFPSTNFTYPFVTAAEGHFVDICKFLIDKKVPIDLFTFSKELFKLNSIDEQIFNLLIKDADQEDIDILFGNLMYKAIELHNKKIVEFLFTHDIRYANALFNAVINKDIEIVKVVLKYSKPSFINQLSRNGTALNIAVQNHDFNMVQFLLTVPGINPNLYNKESHTPLISAIINADIEIVNLLLDYYGDNIQSQLWQVNLALIQILDNQNKIDNKDSKDQINDLERKSCVIKRLLKIQNLDLNCSSKSNTLLTYACEINDLELVKILVESNKIDVNKYAPINGFTPLMVAIMKKDIEIVKYLIELPQTNLNIQNYNSETALFLAVSNEIPDIVTLIMNNDKFDPVESDIDHAFYIANDFIASQLILANCLDVNYREANNEGDKQQYNGIYLIPDTSLTYAVSKKYISKIKMIVNHSSFNTFKSHVKTAIFMAAHEDQVEIFKILLPFVDNDVNAYLKPNDSLLKNSVIHKSENIINEILKHESFDSEKSDLLTAFHLIFCHKTNEENVKHTAIFNSMISIYEYDSQNKKLIDFTKLLPDGKSYFTSISYDFTNISDIVNFFLEHGCDPDSPDQTGIYPLEHAIKLNSYVFVNLLVETKRIDFNRKFSRIIKEGEHQTNKPSSPNKKYTVSIRKNLSYLHLAITKQNPKIFSKLLKLNVIDINDADDNDETPLFYAVKYFRIDIIQKLFLLDNLDYEHKNKKGMDAIKFAQHLFALYSKRNLRVDHDTNKHYETKGDYLTELLSILNLFKAVG